MRLPALSRSHLFTSFLRSENWLRVLSCCLHQSTSEPILWYLLARWFSSVWLKKSVKLWQGAVLASTALTSALLINHFAGDYGIGMLYYRNFVGTPITPGEMTIRLSLHGYALAFRSGITLFMASFCLPFALAGCGAFLTLERLRPLWIATMAYALLHFLVLPNWQERWFGVFYLSMGLATATLVGHRAATFNTPASAIQHEELAA